VHGQASVRISLFYMAHIDFADDNTLTRRDYLKNTPKKASVATERDEGAGLVGED
jgi:hypothetical protein